jgi:hypothetical protein
VNGKNIRISDWAAHERPRERLASEGAQALSDAELLAIYPNFTQNLTVANTLTPFIAGHVKIFPLNNIFK